MTYTIYKGWHRALPFICGFLNQEWMERDVVFDDSFAYDIGEDQLDVNKLFGFGYLNGLHHKDSARYGWNYKKETGRAVLWAYCYVNGVRQMVELCSVNKYTKVRLSIRIVNKHYVFTVNDGYNEWHTIGWAEIPFTHDKKTKYKLGCYFGGNRTATHKTTIKISKK